MKATVIQAHDNQELERRLNEFLKSGADGKPPTIRYIAQSEYAHQESGLKRALADNPPHITLTILWEAP